MDVASTLPPAPILSIMNVYTLKSLVLTLFVASFSISAYAQFDDVYYDPDKINTGSSYDYDDDDYSDPSADGVTYYDNDEYEYYDDYDYYYSSRIKRFHRYYSGFDFYDPIYTSYNYYDPYDYDLYYYPGSTIYISFGNDYWNYRNWRRWQRWNRWNNWGSYYGWGWHSPASYYYSYNSWCSPSYNYWGGYNGYYSYNNYYYNYYNSCPTPLSNYYGVTHYTVNNLGNGNTRGTYYGPRTSGITGSSPRGPIDKPGNVQPVMKDNDKGVTQSNDRPTPGETPGVTGRTNPGTPTLRPDANNPTPSTPVTKMDKQDDGVRQIPVDKELPRSEAGSKRPVFKPEYKPYPTNETPRTGSDKPADDKPVYRPAPESRPSAPKNDSNTPRNNSDRTTPSREDNRPAYSPPARDDRPRYTPPARPSDNDRQPQNDRPSYNPPPRNNDSGNDRPSYSPPPRNNDSGRSNDSGRNNSNDRPSYSAPRSSSSSGGNSSGSSRSSSGGGGGSSSSPRSSGRG